jgi:hypothetical protein
MKLFRSARWLLLALLLPLIPASQARAGVFISVGFAPPILPVYVQPACPEPGYMWTPGYWAYGPDGYYWVPGAWVPAPYEGALWTPPYWGWSGGLYVFHPGYWGPHVGYYGGVNYGFGFFGVGFVGGAWHGREFAYNTAVVHVNNVYIHNTYIDRTVIENHTVVRDSRVAYSGGPGGINHPPTTQERTYMHEQHMGATAMQQAHVQAARADRGSYFNSNHGQPQRAAMERPMGFNGRGNGGARQNYRLAPNQPNGYRPNGNEPGRAQPMSREGNPQGSPGRMQPQSRPEYQPRPQQQPRSESRPESHQQSHPPKDHEPRRH